MIARGTLSDLSRVVGSGKYRISFEVEKEPEMGEIQALEGRTLTITARVETKKRSLDANAYYWVLLSRLAAKLRTSATELHNLFLRQYGQPLLMDGKRAYVIIPDTDEAERKALQSDTFHIKPTSEVKIDRQGNRWRTYFLLRGSHEYDSTEFNALLKALVDECKEQGIETLTPDEIERMIAAYGKKKSA